MFHYDTGSSERESFLLLDAPKPEGGPDVLADEESKTVNAIDSTEKSPRQSLKHFLLDRSRKSTQFAHLVFWNLVASIDDSESI